MEANIVKEIKIEKRDVPDRSPYWREAHFDRIQAYKSAVKEGEMPEFPLNVNEVVYERMTLIDPETKERKNYYVNVNERKLWEQLVSVSDGFINRKIEEGIQNFRDNWIQFELPKLEKKSWQKGVLGAWDRFKALPWYKRLLVGTRFYSPACTPAPTN